jgi:hypothetical protein
MHNSANSNRTRHGSLTAIASIMVVAGELKADELA